MSIFDKASMVLLASGAAGKGGDGDGTIYNIKPEEKLTGNEIAVDGTFDDASGWTNGGDPANTNWSISGGKAVCDGQQSAGVAIYRNMGAQTGKTVRVSFEISDRTAGSVGVVFYATTDTVQYFAKNGKHSFYHTIGSGGSDHNGNIGFSANSTFDGKVDNLSIVEVSQKAVDLNLNRGANIGATRVDKNGLIEKGNTQLLYNTVWDGITASNSNDSGTGWTKAGAQNGALTATNDQGQITFSAPTTSDRRYLLSPEISVVGIYAQSVSVDAVSGQVKIKEVMRSNSSNNTTKITTLEDGVKVSGEAYVTAGKRYTLIYNLESSTTYFRFGIGTNPVDETNVSVTLSKPQVTYGLVDLPYVENTSTTSTKNFGLLVDEPRFDYTGGGCPKLLLERQSINKLPHSEYFESWTSHAGITLTTNTSDVKSPEGLYNATKVVSTDAGDGFYKAGLSVTEDIVHSIYLRGANGGETVTLQDSSGYPSPGGQKSITLTDEWVRYEFPLEYNGTNAFQGTFVNNISVGTIYAWGAQMEEGPFASSYIPSYGTDTTRDADVITNLAIPGVNNDEYTFFVHEVSGLEENGNRGPRLTDPSAGGSNQSLMGHFVNSGGKTFFCYTDSGSGTKAFPNHTSTTDIDAKYAFTVDNVNLRVRGFVNGDLIGDGTPTVTTVPTHISIGSGDGDPNEIHQIMYFPMALSNTEVKILTGATSYNSFGAMTDALTNYTTYE